jgi:hypothetical protein
MLGAERLSADAEQIRGASYELEQGPRRKLPPSSKPRPLEKK